MRGAPINCALVCTLFVPTCALTLCSVACARRCPTTSAPAGTCTVVPAVHGHDAKQQLDGRARCRLIAAGLAGFTCCLIQASNGMAQLTPLELACKSWQERRKQCGPSSAPGIWPAVKGTVSYSRLISSLCAGGEPCMMNTACMTTCMPDMSFMCARCLVCTSITQSGMEWFVVTASWCHAEALLAMRAHFGHTPMNQTLIMKNGSSMLVRVQAARTQLRCHKQYVPGLQQLWMH